VAVEIKIRGTGEGVGVRVELPGCERVYILRCNPPLFYGVLTRGIGEADHHREYSVLYVSIQFPQRTLVKSTLSLGPRFEGLSDLIRQMVRARPTLDFKPRFEHLPGWELDDLVKPAFELKPRFERLPGWELDDLVKPAFELKPRFERLPGWELDDLVKPAFELKPRFEHLPGLKPGGPVQTGV
jgi:hypothetical protein